MSGCKQRRVDILTKSSLRLPINRTVVYIQQDSEDHEWEIEMRGKTRNRSEENRRETKGITSTSRTRKNKMRKRMERDRTCEKALEAHRGLGHAHEGVSIVRLKLAFCTTCVVRVLVLAQGPSFLRLRRALVKAKRGFTR